MEKILIIGASGQIGSDLTLELRKLYAIFAVIVGILIAIIIALSINDKHSAKIIIERDSTITAQNQIIDQLGLEIKELNVKIEDVKQYSLIDAQYENINKTINNKTINTSEKSYWMGIIECYSEGVFKTKYHTIFEFDVPYFDFVKASEKKSLQKYDELFFKWIFQVPKESYNSFSDYVDLEKERNK